MARVRSIRGTIEIICNAMNIRSMNEQTRDRKRKVLEERSMNYSVAHLIRILHVHYIHFDEFSRKEGSNFISIIRKTRSLPRI